MFGEISVRVLEPSDGRRLQPLVNAFLQKAPYSSLMDQQDIQTQIFRFEPPTVHPAQFQRHLQLGAWCDDNLVGFLDVAVGLDSEALNSQRLEPVGILRFLALDDREGAPDAGAVAQSMLRIANHFWQESNVSEIRAFSFSTGYPSFQSGIGVLPGNWNTHFSVLTQAGYRLKERYYCKHLPLKHAVNEVLPNVELQFVRQRVEYGWHYQMLARGIQVAIARVFERTVDTPRNVSPVAYLAELTVAEEWRGQGIAKWLVRRIINDGLLLGCNEIALHVSHSDGVAISLFTQHGFEDINYRGYVLEKQV
jgi:ribosomal protein S18 acetylase RimI-like enzyme